jgi:hypothetical protein
MISKDQKPDNVARAEAIMNSLPQRRATDRKDLPAHVLVYFDAVTAGGGKFQSVWEGLVLFDSPATGSTLALPVSKVTPDAVREHIAASNAKFGK